MFGITKVLITGIFIISLTRFSFAAPSVQIVDSDGNPVTVTSNKLEVYSTSKTGSPDLRDMTVTTVCSAKSIASGLSVYTDSFDISTGEYFALSYQATSVLGTPNMGIELEQSTSLPAVEGAADANWVEAENYTDIVTGLTSETVHNKSFSPIAMPYARFRINEALASDAKLTIKVSQEVNN
jgi:hypothetical protein